MEEGIALVCCMKYRHNQGKYFPGANYDLSEEINYYILRPVMMSLNIQVAPYLEHCLRSYQQLLHYNPLLRAHEHNVIQYTLRLRLPIWFSLLLHPAYLICLDYHRRICLCKKEINVFEVYE